MSLRRQLLVVSLMTLVLPWAGCQFVRETESALRNAQQQMLSGTAVAIADSLSQFPGEFLASGDGGFDNDQVYDHPLARAPVIDGYFDDWSLDIDSLRSLRGVDGTNAYIFGTFRQHVYVYIDVRDDNVIYARSADSNTDQVTLVSVEEDGTASQIVFATEAPGKIRAKRSVGQDYVVANRVVAHWQDTAKGYRVEARIPRGLIGSRVGIEVADFDGVSTIISRSFSRTLPGQFVATSPLLASVASGYVQPGMQLIITNPAGWRLARAGSLSAASRKGNQTTIPAGWQLLIYRSLLERGENSALADPDPSGHENQNYVARALNGETATRWFRNEDTGRAIVAVAQPIWSGNIQTGALVLQQDTDAILSLTNATLIRLITFTVIATIGVALALIGYASWLSLRVRRLSHAADHALDTAQPTTDLPSAEANDEIGDLSRSFSSVLNQLSTYNEYLRSLASKLSHELRTPLTIVTSSLENLDHEPLSEQSREYTERAQTGAKRLQKILSAMSEASRVEQLMENVDAEEFNIHTVLKSTVAAYRDAWPARVFEYQSEEFEDRINGSPELIVQMLDKLVDNAVDFSNAGETIEIELERSEDTMVLSVTNPGPPLPELMRHRLFESMVSLRGDDSSENLGLGLNIAKLIAEGHGGSIRGENVEDGVRFEVMIPLA